MNLTAEGSQHAKQHRESAEPGKNGADSQTVTVYIDAGTGCCNHHCISNQENQAKKEWCWLRISTGETGQPVSRWLMDVFLCHILLGSSLWASVQAHSQPPPPSAPPLVLTHARSSKSMETRGVGQSTCFRDVPQNTRCGPKPTLPPQNMTIQSMYPHLHNSGTTQIACIGIDRHRIGPLDSLSPHLEDLDTLAF